MARVREWGGAEDFRDFVIELGKDVEKGEKGLVVIEGIRLRAGIESPSESEMVGKDVQRGEGTCRPQKDRYMLEHNPRPVAVWCRSLV